MPITATLRERLAIVTVRMYSANGSAADDDDDGLDLMPSVHRAFVTSEKIFAKEPPTLLWFAKDGGYAEYRRSALRAAETLRTTRQKEPHNAQRYQTLLTYALAQHCPEGLHVDCRFDL